MINYLIITLYNILAASPLALAAIGGWKGLRPSQPSVAASLQFLGAWPPVLQKKNHATFYSETGYVTVMAVKLKKICLGIIELLLLKSYLYFTPIRQ